MVKCCFVDRECTEDCLAFNTTGQIKCTVLAKADRTTQLLNFIEKKLDRMIDQG